MLALLVAPASMLRWSLRQLPRPILARLDAWAHREAQRRAARRRGRMAQER